MTTAGAPLTVRPLTLALVDDDAMLLPSLEMWLNQAGEDVEVAIAVSGWTELLVHPRFPVDVVMLDYKLDDGIPAPFKVSTLTAAGVACVMISTDMTSAEVRACIAAGARGYLPKTRSPHDLIEAARLAASGGDYLTPDLAALLMGEGEQGEDVPRLSRQELRAFTLYASGLAMKNVASRLNIRYDTAKDYIDRVRQKYEDAGRSARTKIELRERAIEDGYLSRASPTS